MNGSDNKRSFTYEKLFTKLTDVVYIFKPAWFANELIKYFLTPINGFITMKLKINLSEPKMYYVIFKDFYLSNYLCRILNER